MKRILAALALALLSSSALAADNAIVVTPGAGVTVRSVDVGAGVQSPMSVLGSSTGTAIYGTAGTANANIISVQGIASMTPLLINPGTAALWGVNTLGSTTAGQSGVIALGAVTTAAPTYTTAQSNALSLDTAGNLRVNVVTGGAGGGAVTVADGADVAEGAKADTVCSTDTGTCSVVALLKRNNQNVSTGSAVFGSAFPSSGIAIAGSDGTNAHSIGVTLIGSAPIAGTYAVATGSGASSYVDGWDVTQGAKADAVCGTATGTCSEIALTKFIASAVSGAIPAGTNTIGGTIPTAAATGGATPTGNIAANNTTAVVVKASPGTLYGVQLGGIGAAPAYLKIYNATSATCGSGTPVKRLIIPAAATAANGGGSNITFGPVGVAFSTGITYCVTTGITDADTTAPAASTYLVNFDWN